MGVGMAILWAWPCCGRGPVVRMAQRCSSYFQCAAIDLDTLLCNLGDIVELSNGLLMTLMAATDGLDFEEQIIGK